MFVCLYHTCAVLSLFHFRVLLSTQTKEQKQGGLGTRLVKCMSWWTQSKSAEVKT